jgi:hypothetical protein
MGRPINDDRRQNHSTCNLTDGVRGESPRVWIYLLLDHDYYGADTPLIYSGSESFSRPLLC